MDPDLKIRRGVGGGGIWGVSDHPDPEIGGGLKKRIFRTLEHQFGLKIRGWPEPPAPPHPPPGSATVSAINTAEGEQRIKTELQDCLQLPNIGREKVFEE